MKSARKKFQISQYIRVPTTTTTPPTPRIDFPRYFPTLYTSTGLTEGWLKPVIWKVMDIENVVDAHKDIIENSGAKGQIVLNITPATNRFGAIFFFFIYSLVFQIFLLNA